MLNWDFFVKFQFDSTILYVKSRLYCTHSMMFPGRRWPEQEGRRIVRGGDRQDRDDHAEPQTIQDPRLVPQQTKGRQGRQNLSGDGQLVGQQTARGSWAAEEDPCPQGLETLLGRPCPRSAHQDHRQEGKNRRCVQEEVIFLCCYYLRRWKM